MTVPGGHLSLHRPGVGAWAPSPERGRVCPPGEPGNGFLSPAVPHLPPTYPSLEDPTVASILKPLHSPGPPSWVLPWLVRGKGSRAQLPLLPPTIQQVVSGTGPQCPRQMGRADSRRAALPAPSRRPGGGRRGAERFPAQARPLHLGWGCGDGREALVSPQPGRGRNAGLSSPRGRAEQPPAPPIPRPLAAKSRGNGGEAGPAGPACPEPRARRAFRGRRRSSGGSRSLPGRPAAHGGAGSNLGRNGSGAEATAPRGPVPAAASLAAPPAGLIAESGLIGNANGN